MRQGLLSIKSISLKISHSLTKIDPKIKLSVFALLCMSHEVDSIADTAATEADSWKVHIPTVWRGQKQTLIGL